MTTESAPVSCAEGIRVAGAPSLISLGWEQRTVTDPSRVGDLQQLYTELGFETKVVGLEASSFGEACNECAITACATYQALFTRRPDEA